MVRYKNRYITIEVKQEKGVNLFTKLSAKELSRQILGTINRLHGDFGVASVRNGFAASYCNEVTQIAILRVRHGPHKFVTSALPIITKLGNIPVKINTLYVGATLHQCYKVILRFQKHAVVKLLPDVRQEEKSIFEQQILNLGGFLAKNKREKYRKLFFIIVAFILFSLFRLYTNLKVDIS